MKYFLIKVSNRQIASFCFLINFIESQRSIDSEEHRKAQRTLPGLCKCCPTCVRPTHNVTLVYGLRPPTQDEFENVIWYPGLKAVERRKLEYIHRHPQIRAYSGPFLPDNYSLDKASSWQLVLIVYFLAKGYLKITAMSILFIEHHSSCWC
jgi:hypothetical protein